MTINLSEMVADTEQEILRLVTEKDAPTAGLYEMCRYHMGLDGNAPK